MAISPEFIDDNPRFKTLISKLHREGKRKKRVRHRIELMHEDQQKQAECGIVQQQTSSFSETAERSDLSKTLTRARSCYICKKPYRELHFYYHQLCPDCAGLNWMKRNQRTDLTGYRAFLTGGRIKIGFETALKLLRDGAEVDITTRFPADAAQRYEQIDDVDEWRDRLHIHALDLRDLPALEEFLSKYTQYNSTLDIIINNAAQTIKRPLAFYQHLLQERQLSSKAVAMLADYDASKVVLWEAENRKQSLLPGEESYFPLNQYDQYGQQFDLRPMNSWRQQLGDIDAVEMLEVYLVNAAAPFMINNRLKKLMIDSRKHRKFIVNVSAMEGQFNRQNKTSHHPHTNMAKAALNMMTRTCADDLRQVGVYINSVDTGWITDEKPHPDAQRVQHQDGFYPPLDVIDGAARIYDPIVSGLMPDTKPLLVTSSRIISLIRGEYYFERNERTDPETRLWLFSRLKIKVQYDPSEGFRTTNYEQGEFQSDSLSCAGHSRSRSLSGRGSAATR
ncbi:MAG: SDR family oxidoreductase [Planctomycetaceae bacterium]